MSKHHVSTLEILPNELILEIYKYLTARELYDVFYKFNRRLRKIIDSVTNLDLSIINEEIRFPIRQTFSRVTRLNLDRVKDINLNCFPNIRSLTWINPSGIQLQHICSFRYISLLRQLRVYNTPHTSLTARFHQFVFSNGFSQLRICNLNYVDISLVWTDCFCLRAISIRNVDNPHIFERILNACPNLARLDFNIPSLIAIHISSAFQHINLKKLHLIGFLSSESIDHMLAMTPALIQFNVKGTLRGQPLIYFENLRNSFNRFLPYINRFDCDLLFNTQYEDLTRMQSILYKFHPCFQDHIQLVTVSYGRVRIYTLNNS